MSGDSLRARAPVDLGPSVSVQISLSSSDWFSSGGVWTPWGSWRSCRGYLGKLYFIYFFRFRSIWACLGFFFFFLQDTMHPFHMSLNRMCLQCRHSSIILVFWKTWSYLIIIQNMLGVHWSKKVENHWPKRPWKNKKFGTYIWLCEKLQNL